MKQKTESLCPKCLKTIPALKVKKGAEVWLEKKCPLHGDFLVKIAKDAKRFFDKTYDVEGKPFKAVTKFKGNCGQDCGWCEEHKQHICTGLIEITDACNLSCPICYFGKKEQHYISVAEFKARLQTLHPSIIEYGAKAGYNYINSYHANNDSEYLDKDITPEKIILDYCYDVKQLGGGIVPVTVGFSQGNRNDPLYNYIDILICALLDCGARFVSINEL